LGIRPVEGSGTPPGGHGARAGSAQAFISRLGGTALSTAAPTRMHVTVATIPAQHARRRA
jgi:hypothetical protein